LLESTAKALPFDLMVEWRRSNEAQSACQLAQA
jgi:hypothetical protein